MNLETYAQRYGTRVERLDSRLYDIHKDIIAKYSLESDNINLPPGSFYLIDDKYVFVQQ